MIELPFCPKCGTEVPADAVFCTKCGSQIRASPASLERSYGRREKAEKGEKGEKEEKHEKEEKPSDRTGAIVGGLILIWLGISFYLVQTRYIGWDEWWPYLLIGIGIILLVQAIIRYWTVRLRGAAMGSLIGGAVLIIIGLAGTVGMKDWWPFVLIAIGVVVIITVVTARARTPKPK